MTRLEDCCYRCPTCTNTYCGDDTEPIDGLCPGCHESIGITQPGIYDMSNAAYHRETGWLSSTYLKSLLPEFFKQGGSQDALDFGSLFHVVVLEPDHLDDFPADNGLAVLDPKVIGIKADGKPSDSPTSTKAWKDAVAAEVAAGRRVITATEWQSMLDRAHAMADAVREHETAAELLYGIEGTVEESVFADVAGVPCRARFDKRIPSVILDLKSTSSKPGADSLSRSVADYGYDLSAAHYLAVAEAAGLDIQTFALVFVDKSDDHRVTVCDIDDSWLERGRALRDLAIRRHCGQADAYEGATGFLTLTRPRWARIPEGLTA